MLQFWALELHPRETCKLRYSKLTHSSKNANQTDLDNNWFLAGGVCSSVQLFLSEECGMESGCGQEDALDSSKILGCGGP